jgi:NADH:ubiquinone oxidoreductase subunit C
MQWSEIEKRLKDQFGKEIEKWTAHNERRIYLDIPVQSIQEFARMLFDDLKARFIIASGVDTSRGVVEILYHFDFYQMPQVLSLRVQIPKTDLKIDSIAGIIKGAEWIEREINELFGIEFTGHPDMRHLLLPDDWPEGKYPLRRDQ